MQVNVRLFASLREAVGQKELRRQVPEGTTVGDLLAALIEEYPRLAQAARRAHTAVNHQYVPVETVLRDGDEVALFPPVSGGKVDDGQETV
jgi:molybdopterin converting factor subunit 1